MNLLGYCCAWSLPDEHGRNDRYDVRHLAGQLEQNDRGRDCVRDGAGKRGGRYNLRAVRRKRKAIKTEN